MIIVKRELVASVERTLESIEDLSSLPIDEDNQVKAFIGFRGSSSQELWLENHESSWYITSHTHISDPRCLQLICRGTEYQSRTISRPVVLVRGWDRSGEDPWDLTEFWRKTVLPKFGLIFPSHHDSPYHQSIPVVLDVFRTSIEVLTINPEAIVGL